MRLRVRVTGHCSVAGSRVWGAFEDYVGASWPPGRAEVRVTAVRSEAPGPTYLSRAEGARGSWQTELQSRAQSWRSRGGCHLCRAPSPEAGPALPSHGLRGSVAHSRRVPPWNHESAVRGRAARPPPLTFGWRVNICKEPHLLPS